MPFDVISETNIVADDGRLTIDESELSSCRDTFLMCSLVFRSFREIGASLLQFLP